MDGYEAYINIALYDSKHVDFLSSTPSSRGYAGFMHLIERGPYDLRRWEPDGLGSFLTDVAILMGGPKATLELKFPELKVK